MPGRNWGGGGEGVRCVELNTCMVGIREGREGGGWRLGGGGTQLFQGLYAQMPGGGGGGMSQT